MLRIFSLKDDILSLPRVKRQTFLDASSVSLSKDEQFPRIIKYPIWITPESSALVNSLLLVMCQELHNFFIHYNYFSRRPIDCLPETPF